MALRFAKGLLPSSILVRSTNVFVQTLSALQRASTEQDPLFRLFVRESQVGRKLLLQVRKDLSNVIEVCEGRLKQTNHLRTLMSHLTKGNACSYA